MKVISRAALCCALLCVVGCGKKKSSEPLPMSTQEPVVVHEIETSTVVYNDGHEDEFKVFHQKVRVSGVQQEGMTMEEVIK